MPRLRRMALGAAVVVALLAFGLWASWPRPLAFVLDRAGLLSPPVDPPLPDEPSVAVLPFTNMSGDPEQEYFSDGIAEDLTTDLSRYPGIFVIARNSAFTYKGAAVRVRDVGRELGVRYIVEGSARKAGNRVRVTAQLIDALTGLHIWSERYDRELDDIFALQSELSEAILIGVGLEIQDAEFERIRRRPVDDLTAYDKLLKGLYYYGRVTRSDMAEAERLLEQATRSDPGYARAHVFLGLIHGSQYFSMWDLDPARIDRLEELSGKALELDPSLAEGYLGLTMGRLLRGDSASAVAHAQQAVDLSPNLFAAHAWLGVAQIREGRPLAGIQSIRRGMRLNPRAPVILLGPLANANYRAGRTEEAIRMWERVREAYPDSILSRIALADHYARVERLDDAQQLAQEILLANPTLTAEQAARAYARLAGSGAIGTSEANLRRAGLP